ncbi:MAG: D-aminoacyl-tRNA deacylase [Halodesulfurarchaeum sp.]
MIGIVVSNADRASVTIGRQLQEVADWTENGDGVYRRDGFELREFEELHLELDGVASAFDDPEYVVVVSKHSGDTGPLLSAHFTGNFGEAEYGGSARELVEPAPAALKRVICTLDAVAPEPYDVSMECTHHGPSDLGAPGMFVELGSGPDEWTDEVGARAVAEAVLDLQGVEPRSERTVVAFGGNHYAPQPTRILLETDVSVGHVAADWSIEELGDPEDNRSVIEAMFEKSGTDRALVDGDWPAVTAVIESLGYEVVSETWARESSGVDPALIEDLEAALGPVEAGLRFGERSADEPAIRPLPGELIGACAAIDSEETVTTVADHTVAYQTAENGNRVGDRAAFDGDDSFDELIDGLVTILEREYETVERRDGAVVAERESFDPELAAAAGVPEGPLFGRLNAGESVTVEGERVDPADVHTRETRRFEV